MSMKRKHWTLLFLLIAGSYCHTFAQGESPSQAETDKTCQMIKEFYSAYITNMLSNDYDANRTLREKHFTQKLWDDTMEKMRVERKDPVFPSEDVCAEVLRTLKVAPTPMENKFKIEYTTWNIKGNFTVTLADEEGRKRMDDLGFIQFRQDKFRQRYMYPFTSPESSYFYRLYDDDFKGDTLVINGKMYFFSQSPIKQFSEYMFGEKDPRYVLGYGPREEQTHGKADKGYVLHFRIGKDGAAYVDGATYDGFIYPKH